jgi:hypothetical protein
MPKPSKNIPGKDITRKTIINNNNTTYNKNNYNNKNKTILTLTRYIYSSYHRCHNYKDHRNQKRCWVVSIHYIRRF